MTGRVHRLHRVDGAIAFDLDDCPHSAGGTRMAPDADDREVALLARAMTYKFAVLEARVGGAKAVIRHDPAASDRAAVMARYCAEIAPLVAARTFVTGPDMGTFEADFTPLRGDDPAPDAMGTEVDGTPFEDLLTGFGVVVSAEAALGSLDGRTVAIEGFGKVGGGVAREVVARGGTVVAVSTLAGCVVDPGGLDVARLWQARAEHGDGFVQHVGGTTRPASALFDVAADVLVPGARPGAIDAARAERGAWRVIAPAANVPYTSAAVAVLRARKIVMLPDYVCNAGAVMGYRSSRHATPAEVLGDVQGRLGNLVRRCLAHPGGALAGGAAIAEAFLSTWHERLPDGPPLA